MQRKCKAPRSFREDANPEAFKEVRLIFLIIFSLSLELNALHLQASAGINTHIYAHDYAGRTTGVVHTEVRIRSHTCIFTFLCACRVVVGHAKKEIERERETVEDTYVQTAPKVYETRHLRRDIHAIIR